MQCSAPRGGRWAKGAGFEGVVAIELGLPAGDLPVADGVDVRGVQPHLLPAALKAPLVARDRGRSDLFGLSTLSC
jgi:hypothetical protein